MKTILKNRLFLAACAPVVGAGLFGFALWVGSAAQQFQQRSTAAAALPSQETDVPAAEPELFEYIEVVNGCGPYFGPDCVNVRSGPGTEYAVVLQLRTGVVLRVVKETVLRERAWYKIVFDEGVRYPERVTSDWYVAAEFVRPFPDAGEVMFVPGGATSTKRITVDRSEQMLYAYEGETLFMQESISTGLEFTPTPRGIFTVYKKTPSRYMQGPLPGISDQYYDLPGVPWNLYFTYQGGVIHGAYWHDKFGQPWSHGCVNVAPERAQKLYRWADVGTQVIVRD